ncbi:signal peptide peptidase SppA [Pelotomaculum isophthalicicum JI]|uniref:Signal peptide peptidase SppA n=1 Tax=Pelotomaculum isophthalicicum JI TaxID=947010 RepID=A0A9X4H2X7_9FIRM|nr:signal peptide peptidase SppA [Pelotomaculum isophthalicicum]MDF9407608.1 signal peptide peptidase SppA [Pelotomaculum isophthalicicum JI]
MSRKIIAGIILGLVALSVVLSFNLRTGNRTPRQSGSDKGKVGVIYIEGTIASGQSDTGLLSSGVSSEEIAATIRKAARDPEIGAVVIRLNSPGGTPAASQEIGLEIERLRQSGKKVVASMGDVAASGAYWVAACTDQIVANPGTMTGSIGVIMQTPNLQGLYDKLGISEETFKSGPYKDMGSSSRPVTTDERAIFQSMIDDIYNQFVDAVAKGRHKDVLEIRKLADGRVFTGRQAIELGLVDQLGDFHDAVLLAGKLAGLSGEPVIAELGYKNIWRNFLGGAWESILSGKSMPALTGGTSAYPYGLR